ncbi:hypothetical protein BDN71DRAFT_1446857 [Pleurotus eryngii]|uniref:Uncharacterized protein n=1 Tax=Pleurotus eryngii TaxID=5323 RepID=A0A9P6A0B9_PLEER|nr:hypothetical protein BDN71DRAFT_1446857 [Pleurotus eryngii]
MLLNLLTDVLVHVNSSYRGCSSGRNPLIAVVEPRKQMVGAMQQKAEVDSVQHAKPAVEAIVSAGYRRYRREKMDLAKLVSATSRYTLLFA